MTAVAVSPKFQVVIPRDIRSALGIKAGQRVEMFAFQGRIELVPLQPIERMRGIAKGISVEVDRDGDRL